jgi:hypothetical protein
VVVDGPHLHHLFWTPHPAAPDHPPTSYQEAASQQFGFNGGSLELESKERTQTLGAFSSHPPCSKLERQPGWALFSDQFGLSL